MRKLIFILLFTPFISFSQKQKPKLVLGIVVDQMRYDYIAKYWNKFGEEGFKKLVNEGFNCKNTNFNYIPTFTGPGHASIYTGTTPENHGIISNTWYDKVNNKNIYCVQDDEEIAVGSTTLYGKMSPRNLLSTTITDELKLATNNKGKVIGLSLKDRGAILPAGHMANAAYWFEGGAVGQWISSSYYMNELPAWLKKLNQTNPAEKYLSKPWNTLYPIETYTESIADDNKYEGKFSTEKAPVFPHNLPALRDSNFNYSLIKATPFGNAILKDLAITTIKEENLGKDEITDFLTVSFSCTDYVGHQFGPTSIEVEDTYLRLDKDLAEFFKFIDNTIGKENVLLFLTADHGAVNVPHYLMDNNLPGGYFDNANMVSKIKSFLKNKYLLDSLVLSVSNNQIFLNHALIQQNSWNSKIIEDEIAELILNQKGVAKVVTANSLKSTEFTNRILADVQRGFNQVRSGDILYVLQSGWIPVGYSTGTTHGSPYNYDTHVPLLWYGFGVNQGTTNQVVFIPDIAATIAAILNIQPPSACTGKPIQSVIKK